MRENADQNNSEYGYFLRSVYGSYNAEVAADTIKSVTLENISQSYSVTNELKFDFIDQAQKYLLYMQFVAWYCIT